MPKFFEYEDLKMAAHVEKIVSLAKDVEDNESVVTYDRTTSAISNREKPFAPMTVEDMNHRMALGDGAGKDNFVVAKHREEQNKIAKKYESMASWDRDAGGVFHVTAEQIAGVAQTVVDVKVKEQKDMGFFKRIKEALSFSEEAKKKRAMMKDLKEAAKKGS